MSSKIRIVRNAYLYIASLISLLFVAIGVYTLVNTAMKAYVFPKADRGNFSRCNQQPPIPVTIYTDVENNKQVATEDQKRQLDNFLADYEKWKKENTGEDCLAADRQSNIADALTMILIALPIYLFHWNIIKKEKEEKETE